MMDSKYIDIFIPSYHRPRNIKTMKYMLNMGWPSKKITVFVDNEADDIEEYEDEVKRINKCNLVIFDMQEARRRYDYVHRASVSRRSAGQARNMFQDYAKKNRIDFYCVQDDDTRGYQTKLFGKYMKVTSPEALRMAYNLVKEMMKKHHIGVFGLPQTGDLYNNNINTRLFIRKVMNTTFYNVPFVYRGERGIQDNDTSQFINILNEGLFTGSLASGIILSQTQSATQKGGLTDLYNECKLLNKSLIAPIQFPSAIHAERQEKNGARLHHKINYRYLAPRILKGARNNIAWDTYPEDYPFTNEPKREFTLNR